MFNFNDGRYAVFIPGALKPQTPKNKSSIFYDHQAPKIIFGSNKKHQILTDEEVDDFFDDDDDYIESHQNVKSLVKKPKKDRKK